MLAITHVPSPQMDQCQRQYVARAPIDHCLAVRQHQDYCRMLRDCGVDVCVLEANQKFPDCAFVEDAAIVLDECAVLASMGTDARRCEPARIEVELRRYREIHRVELPATIEGGDVLRVDRTLLVGLSSRTNADGAAALEALVRPCGYRVVTARLRQCLHLKTACTALPDGRLLVNPEWLDVRDLQGFDLVRIPDEEPWAANVMRLGSLVCMSAAHTRTANTIREMGFAVHLVDLSEFAKAEGGVTCLSLLLDQG